ncbi:hypothetical protein HDU85_002871 [Gaertneriomyces sp. JEL0708]|nr:hypothetical protein HDU85_002871 [Gaertneriomyces sp. JEL0708]
MSKTSSRLAPSAPNTNPPQQPNPVIASRVRKPTTPRSASDAPGFAGVSATPVPLNQANIGSSLESLTEADFFQPYHPSPDVRTLFESQSLGPAPSQTYHQLRVQSDNICILRSWPRKRLSQKWTRDGGLNPTETRCSYEEFLEGEFDQTILAVFGQETLDKVTEIVKKQWNAMR